MRVRSTWPPALRLVATLGVFVLGEAVGFSLQPLSVCWKWVGFFSSLSFLWAFAAGGRHLMGMGVLVLGMVLAMRTDATLRLTLDENAGLYGRRKHLLVQVESSVNRGRNRSDGTTMVDFLSHLGPSPLKVVLPVKAGGRCPAPGETWELDGWISRKQDQEGGNRFGRRTLWIPSPQRVKPMPSVRTFSPVAFYWKVSEELSRRIGDGLSWCPELVRLNRAILLGRRDEIPREDRHMFADAGTVHVFAISGLHVMVVAGLLRGLLKRMDLEEPMQGLLLVPLLVAYVILTGGSPSAVRAATMASLYFLAPVFGRRPDALSAWALTAWAVYSLSPERLFDLGCSLSFAVMFGIVVYLRWVRQFAFPLLDNSGWWGRIAGSLGVSFAAWVAGVPLVAHAFGRFTPGGLLANVFVLWCVNVLVKVGFGAVAAGFLSPPLAVLLNTCAAACTWLMVSVSKCVAALPFASFAVRPWTVPACAAWYAGWLLFVLLLGRYLPRRVSAPRCWWK